MRAIQDYEVEELNKDIPLSFFILALNYCRSGVYKKSENEKRRQYALVLHSRSVQVDPVGVEPTSKQGISELSTCLFCNYFSMLISPQTGKLNTYHMIFNL